LNGLRDMKMLRQLDLSKNALTGTLEPLVNGYIYMYRS
jgi:hypothetical protein